MCLICLKFRMCWGKRLGYRDSVELGMEMDDFWEGATSFPFLCPPKSIGTPLLEAISPTYLAAAVADTEMSHSRMPPQ